MANAEQDKVLRLSKRIDELEGSSIRKVGALSVVLSSPESFTANNPTPIGFSSKVIENGIISGNIVNGTFTASEDCTVLLIYQQEITHTNIDDDYHLDLYGNSDLKERIASCKTPPGVTSTAVFAASVNLSARVTYGLKICAGGASGTHIMRYENVRNRMSIMVTGCTGATGPQGRKGDKGDKGDAGANAPNAVIVYSADGQNWHSAYTQGDDYIRFSMDGGNLFGNAVCIRGRQGLQGMQGETGTSYRMRGAYESGTSYVNDTVYIDCVTYNGCSYYAKQDTIGNSPENTLYWGVLAQKGIDGSGTGDVTGPSTNTGDKFPQWNGNDSKELKDGMSLGDIVLAAKQSVYPVGSLYYNADNPVNPATLLGFGTWAAFGAGRVPVGYASGDSIFGTVGATPGEKAHTLLSTEMPAHAHTMNTHSHTINHGHAAFGSDPEAADHSHYISGSTWGAGSHGHNLQWNGDRYISLSGSSAGGNYQPSGYRTGYSSGGVYDWSMIASPVGDHAHGMGFQSQGRSASHTHNINTPYFSGSSGDAQPAINSAGGGGSHNNIQPSIVVYIWKRTA